VAGGRQEGTPPTVTGRAMAILGAFSDDRPVMGLQELSRRTGLSVSTTHRLAGELVKWGALARCGEFEYQVGPLILRLATATPRARREKNAAPIRPSRAKRSG
jgi:DNA-binding IclR family transcriptional regulator